MTIDGIGVQAAVDGIVSYGCGRLLHDLYRDLRRHGSCVPVCSLLIAALEATRADWRWWHASSPWTINVRRAQAIAALRRLLRWAQGR